MTDPRITRSRDAERAVADLAREHEVLAGMTGADSRRIDGLVKDVGQINGNVEAVRQKVDGVADGVNELRDALTVLVRHDIKMQHTDSEVVSLRRDVADMGARVQTLERHERVQVLERQIGPLVELRTWVIGGGLTVLSVVALAVLALVIRR
jgi:septal ring factor EnvC (AmiA/AmiB activator)